MASLSSSTSRDRTRDPLLQAARVSLDGEHGHGTRRPQLRGSGSRATHSGLAHAEWNLHVRGESEIQRLDRNFVELLQELRVAQTGVQILFAFLLGIVFTPRFVELAGWQTAVYVLTLVLAASAAAVLIAPVMYHRLVFRRRLKLRIVEVTHRHALTGLTLLLLSLIGALTLAVSLVIGPWSFVLCGGLAVLFGTVWFGLPLWHRNGG
jgi:hypothetical protein